MLRVTLRVGGCSRTSRTSREPWVKLSLPSRGRRGSRKLFLPVPTFGLLVYPALVLRFPARGVPFLCCFW